MILKALTRSARGLIVLGVCATALVGTTAFAVAGATPLSDSDAATYNGGKPVQDEEAEEELLQLDLAFTSRRYGR